MLIVRKPYYIPLLLLVPLRFLSEENRLIEWNYETICEFDERILCPECFQNVPRMCEGIENIFIPHFFSWSNIMNSLFNAHGTQFGTILGRNGNAVMKHINRNRNIEQLLFEFCKLRSSTSAWCNWSEQGNIDFAIEYLQKSILNESRIEGCIMCPTNAKRQTLQRFVETIGPAVNELWKFLVIRTNVEPLLLLMASNETLPVPQLLFSRGFIIIESYDGEPLSNFYDHPFTTRLLIASELIKAAVAFTNGIHGFRFLLTDMSPDNIVVRFHGDPSKVAVSFVDLGDVIVVDSLASGISEENNYHVHSKIECDGCFAYVQEDICRYRNSDLNLFSICQLLLENISGKFEGLLHKDIADKIHDSHDTFENTAYQLHNLLQECVNCRPLECRNRSLILQDVMDTITQILIDENL